MVKEYKQTIAPLTMKNQGVCGVIMNSFGFAAGCSEIPEKV